MNFTDLITLITKKGVPKSLPLGEKIYGLPKMRRRNA